VKPFLIAILLVAVGGGTLWLIGAGDDETEREIVTVTRGPFATVVESSGTLRSSESVNISCPKIPNMWQFTITYMAPEGTLVEPGTPLVRFDDRQQRERLAKKTTELSSQKKILEKTRLEEQQNREQLELQLAEAEVEVAKLERKVEVPDHLVSGAEIQKTRYDLELARSRRDLAKKRLDNLDEGKTSRVVALESHIARLEREVADLQTQLEAMTVVAPKAGLVVHTRGRGNKVSVGDSVWFGAVLMTLPELDHMEVAATIAEREAARVEVGQQVEIRLDAEPGRIFTGEVAHLGSVFRQKSSKKPSVVFDATITVLDPDPGLMRPGMAARLEIVSQRVEDVVQVPERAVGFDDAGAYVVNANGRRIEVAIGRRSAGLIEILDGLEAGVTILADPFTRGGS